ncbi:MAG: hypothetical protein NTY37_07465 [Methanothrix sp.]|nr:hypothetical protein [Methanothrix sp.]
MERDELHRVLAICRSNRLSIKIAAYLIENLNEIESGKWKQYTVNLSHEKYQENRMG